MAATAGRGPARRAAARRSATGSAAAPAAVPRPVGSTAITGTTGFASSQRAATAAPLRPTAPRRPAAAPAEQRGLPDRDPQERRPSGRPSAWHLNARARTPISRSAPAAMHIPAAPSGAWIQTRPTPPSSASASCRPPGSGSGTGSSSSSARSGSGTSLPCRCATTRSGHQTRGTARAAARTRPAARRAGARPTRPIARWPAGHAGDPASSSARPMLGRAGPCRRAACRRPARCWRPGRRRRRSATGRGRARPARTPRPTGRGCRRPRRATWWSCCSTASVASSRSSSAGSMPRRRSAAAASRFTRSIRRACILAPTVVRDADQRRGSGSSCLTAGGPRHRASALSRAAESGDDPGARPARSAVIVQDSSP